MLTPIECYRADLERPGFHYDRAQEAVLLKLQILYDDILSDSRKGLLARMSTSGRIPGLYIWGGVGRGKTYLVDLFYGCLPFPQKKRYHFHRFMNKIHRSLNALRNERDPLHLIADRVAPNMRVLCFDEFVVNDITDAMILGGLLKSLFEFGVTLVATSNIGPDDLYKGGLQRDLFLPTIDLIKQHTEVVEMDRGVDYRLQFLNQAEIYFHPLDDTANNGLEQNFNAIAGNKGDRNVSLEIEGREIASERHASGIVWFDFEIICGGPRSQRDYLEIARCFHSVVLANVPQLTEQDDDRARRFINLIDVLYDRNVKLIISAATEPGDLYIGSRLLDEFQRTRSRLMEMRSHNYLARPHLA